MMKKTLLSIFLSYSVCLFLADAAPAATIRLPATGQTKCYDTAGAEISCAGTGQDGDKRMGLSWNEANRFKDNNNGTITDTLTGLIWLKNANCFGGQFLDKAINKANTLHSGECGLTDGSSAGQWRLPSRNELESLINRGQASSAAWLATKGFSNTQESNYWSSSMTSFDLAVLVNFYDGFVEGAYYGNDCYVWPVRGGQ